MNFFESIFLDLGFSWTASKLIPYILMFILGFVIVYTFHKRIQHKWKKWIIIVRSGFPSMILSENREIVHAWQNDHFGVKAIDEYIERATSN